MGLLLDTHIWLWSLLDPGRLSDAVRRAFRSPEGELRLSSISVWEALLLAERGRVTLKPRPPPVAAQSDVAHADRRSPITIDVALTSRTIDVEHQDPADRFIVATAKVYGLKLVTAMYGYCSAATSKCSPTVDMRSANRCSTGCYCPAEPVAPRSGSSLTQRRIRRCAMAARPRCSSRIGETATFQATRPRIAAHTRPRVPASRDGRRRPG